jgi:prepilin-type N-terminal cleavage/methylation domain-containing protein
MRGFTLIELMVVVIIVGVLAIASVPLYQANVRRAMRAEAVATMGSIRSAQRVFKAEHGVYYTGWTYVPVDPDDLGEGYTWTEGATEGAGMLSALNLELEDVAYFGPECYSLEVFDVAPADGEPLPAGFGAEFTIVVTSTADNTASRKERVLGQWADGTKVASMTQDGSVIEQ